MGTTTIIVSVGGFQERDLILEPFPSGKRHWTLSDLTNARDGWGGLTPEAFLFGGVVANLVWDDFAGWIESREWNDPDSIEVLVRDQFADWFEVWRMSSEQGLVQVLSSQGSESDGTANSYPTGTEGFKSFEDSSSWTLGNFGTKPLGDTDSSEPEG